VSLGERPRVLIAGGGFAGLYAALELERRLREEEAELELVAPENFMTYLPLLPEVASGRAEPRHVVVPLRRALARTRVTLGELRGLDPRRRVALIAPAGDGREHEQGYDQVVIALGSVSKLAPIPGLVEHAVGFQTLTEAIHLRNQVLACLEVAQSTRDPQARRRALTFVFVGGGYAGVEALAELEDLARDACRAYPDLSRADMRWVLVEAAERILPSLDERLGAGAAHVLRARGVELRLGCQLRSVAERRLELSDGGHLETDTLVWMTGIQPHPLAARLGLECDQQGRLRVDRCLRVPGPGAAWSAGDCAAVPDGRGGCQPPSAQHAEREGRQLAVNLARVLRGSEPQPFRYRSRGEFVTLGDGKAIAQVLGRRLDGRAAWTLRRGYYLTRMPSPDRRARLALDWLAGLPFARDTAQLGSAQHPDRPLQAAKAAS
jgi:NADH dehydrogenase